MILFHVDETRTSFIVRRTRLRRTRIATSGWRLILQARVMDTDIRLPGDARDLVIRNVISGRRHNGSLRIKQIRKSRRSFNPKIAR